MLPLNIRLESVLYVLSHYPLPTSASKLCMAIFIKNETPIFLDDVKSLIREEIHSAL